MELMDFVDNIGNVRENKFRKILYGFMKSIPVDYFIGFLVDEKREFIDIKDGNLFETF